MSFLVPPFLQLVFGAILALVMSCIADPAVVILRAAGILDTSVPVVSDMTSEIAIVTGANTGIGFETARALAQNGATVILACRSLERGEKARREIERHLAECSLDSRGEMENAFADKGKVLVRELDLADLDSVRRFASGFLDEFKTLDVLVNNAGISPINVPAGSVTKQGLELIFGSNFVGHFLLTQLLLDRLKQSRSSRIVNLASVMHFAASKDIVSTARNVKTSQYAQYGYNDSKLAMILMSKELNRRLRGTTVTAIAVNPGYVASDIWRKMKDTPTIGSILSAVHEFLMGIFCLSPAQGAMPSIYAATQNITSLVRSGTDYLSPYFVPEGMNWCFETLGPFAGVRPTKPRLPPNEEKVSAELWRVCEELVQGSK